MLTRESKSEEMRSPEDFCDVEAWLAAYGSSGDYRSLLAGRLTGRAQSTLGHSINTVMTHSWKFRFFPLEKRSKQSLNQYA